MIDPDTEEILAMPDAARFVQRRFGGRKPSMNTLWRWSVRGLRGVNLETMKRGGTRVTSEEAILRFFDRLAMGGDGSVPAESNPRPSPNFSGVLDRMAAERLIAEGV